jgi:hypothetical protein
MTLRKIIKEHLLLEKRIAQISSELKIIFNFEVDRKKHAFDRATRPELGDSYNQREISNSELKEFVSLFIREISEKIVSGEIKDDESFILKSLNWELAVPVTPVHVDGTYWKLIITTVFRESEENPFRVGRNQLVLWR